MNLQVKLLTFSLVLVLSGTAASGAEPKAAPAPAANEKPTDYVLQPSDLIRVIVFQEPDLLREVRITQENTITLPLVGTINVGNKTVRQAEQIVHDLYNQDYFVNPQISVTVVEYAKRMVNVLGAVGTPGPVVFQPEQKMGLLEAITRAGGFSRIADRKRVRLSRTLPDGKTENFIINVDEMIQGASAEQWQLTKDDVIYVSERLL